MSSYRRKLRDLSGNYVFPATRSTCVYLDDNQTLQEWIDSQSDSGGIDILDVYPVGSTYMSVERTSPSSLFGGSWRQITATSAPYGMYLMIGKSGQTPGIYINGTEDGSITLTNSQLPKITAGMMNSQALLEGEGSTSTNTYYVGRSSTGLSSPQAAHFGNVNVSSTNTTNAIALVEDYLPAYRVNLWERVS